MIPASVKQAYNDVPTGIKLFAKKALLLMAAWLLLYYLVLQPTRVPDSWLTSVTAKTTVKTLNGLYTPGFSSKDTYRMQGGSKNFGTMISFNNNPALFIADACNAFDLYVLFIAFLFCLPTTAKRMFSFSLIGIAGIFILNIARCYALVWLTINKPSWVDFAHHYAFTLIVYSLMFLGWISYSKKYVVNNNRPQLKDAIA